MCAVFVSVFVVVSVFLSFFLFLLECVFGVVHCNVYAPRVLFMHGDALVCRQTTNDFDDNEDDDFDNDDSELLIRPRNAVVILSYHI